MSRTSHLSPASLTRVIAATLVALLTPCLSLASQDGAASASPRGGTTMQSLPSAWTSEIESGIRASEYCFAATTENCSAPNRAQDLRAQVTRAGLTLTSRSAGASGFRLELRATRFGRLGKLSALEPGALSIRGPRVSIDHSNASLTEWYLNQPSGIEQGFTLARPPAGRGALLIELRCEGSVSAALVERDRSVEFRDRSDETVLRYAGLSVTDRSGRVVPSSFELAPEGFTIRVDDSHASYPLTVDPVMSSASWSYGVLQRSAELGFAVATAGDVNGDGYSDVLVGAPLFDTGVANGGRVFLFYGSSAGLASQPGWTEDLGQADAHWGASVAAAGDVNHDGYADIIIGAPLYDGIASGTTGIGTLLVFYGSASGPNINAAWSAYGDQQNDEFGTSVCGVGDVNGDGYDDVAVGAPLYDGTTGNTTDEGRVFVWYGGPGGLGSTGSPSNADWTYTMGGNNSHFGTVVAPAGDVNGDGYDDLAVGAPGFVLGSGTNRGRACVFSGSPLGLTNANIFLTDGTQDGELLGTSVSTAGDVNGDGYADLIVGAPGYTGGIDVHDGMVEAFYGSSTGLGVAVRWAAFGSVAGDQFGASVATAGDVNGDGYADVIIGAPFYDGGQTDQGIAYIWLGGAGGISSLYWTAEGNQSGAHFGAAVATAGDVNGDGFSDVLVGAPLFDNGSLTRPYPAAGRAYLFEGGGDAPLVAASWKRTGSTPSGGNFGISVAGGGDVNGDGFSDVLVGDGDIFNEGRTALYLGSMSGLSAVASWTEPGTYCAFAGDVNGDGYADVILGAPSHAGDASFTGKASLYLGSSSGLVTTPAWTLEGTLFQDEVGRAVASAGDVNGDGYADVLVSANYYNHDGPSERGKVWLYEGSSGGLLPFASWSVEGTGLGELFGFSLAGAGDVNGDGFDDVLVASATRVYLYMGSTTGLSATPAWSYPITYSFAYQCAGAGDVNGDGFADVVIGSPPSAYVFLGSSSGLGVAPAWSLNGSPTDPKFGSSVAGAGDVDGDGFSDVLVGSYTYDGVQPNVGRAYLYRGSPAGPLTTPMWIAPGDSANSHFATALCSAGDVNGDGFADLIVGAPDEGLSGNGPGAAFAFYGDRGTGLSLIPQQWRASSLAPIAPGEWSESATTMRLKMRGRAACGRSWVRHEWQIAPLGTLLSGGVGSVTGWRDTGVPLAPPSGSFAQMNDAVAGLAPGTAYHWRCRARSRSPLFPHTHWLTMPDLAPNLRALKTAGGLVGVEPDAALEGVELGNGTPNPTRGTSHVAFSLPHAGRVRLTLCDISGREIRSLVDDWQSAGSHLATWDGRDGSTQMAQPGIYFFRLEAAGQRLVRRIALLH